MKLGKTLVAGLLISFGTFLLVASFYAPLRYRINSKKQDDRAIAYLLFGLPITFAGGWLIWYAQKEEHKDAQNRLGRIFYLLLQKNNGYITVFQLAREAGTSIKVAEQYLEQKSKECNGIFELFTTGEAVYIFSSNLYEERNIN
jgi:hypothetical protein